jgi:hypothetical protein
MVGPPLDRLSIVFIWIECKINIEKIGREGLHRLSPLQSLEYIK